jgi:serine/threonine-protein kinase
MPTAPDLAGRALDERYEVHEMLGEGAFGRVYRGTDRRLGRDVAVKVIKPWWAEEDAWVERFHREAQMLALVNDPGVVQIFDIGTADEGPYYVAELVEGESLAQRLKSGPLTSEEARSVAERLCRALASAHRQGVTHCDVKPANVLLGVDGKVKVGDFGVARLAEGTSQEPSATVAGTPRYMAPEQARGRPPTAATDVYSAGVVLYEMLAGHPPFVNGSAVELGLRHLQDPPPPLPSTVPASLREVVGRALAKDPGARYRDGAEMAEALRTIAPPAGGAAAEPRSPRAARRRSPRASDASGAGATAIVGVGAAVDRTVSRGDPATDPRIEAGDGAGGDGVQTVVRTRLLANGGAPTPPGRSPSGEAGRRRRRSAVVLAALALAAGGALAALLLSGAVARTTVPELRHLHRHGVEARAGRLHLRPAFSTRYSETPKGLAVAQSPSPGARVADGSTVHVVLSAGPPPVTVPSVVGEASATAEGAIANAGLRYGITTVAAPESAPGIVVSQSPGAPASIPRGSTVQLSVSEAPRWRTLSTFSGVDDGRSVVFRILGRRWRVAYSMSFRGTCVFLVVCGGPHAEALNVETRGSAGGFDLEEGETETHVFSSGPGLYRLLVSGGRDSASWSMTVEDFY